MKIVTTENIAGYEIIDVLGYVKGSTIQTKHVGRDITAALKGLVGGEIKGYNDMMIEARKLAIYRMVEEAKAGGANAIIAMRLQTSTVMGAAAEIIAYGTAVIIKKNEV
ncbi:YbjQ family protein [Bacillus solitudinis]|uniref:YbjQ family protein n=1 Tax=Bacillus solitudinis TaxID=2014074 RepID=UPI000C244515|nr:YbjQ family protein [Bacillus solitudinis]